MFDCDDYLSSGSDESFPPSPIYEWYQSGNGYHAVPPPYIGPFMPPKPDLVFNNAPNDVLGYIKSHGSSYDWSFQADEETTNYALMAFSSLSYSSDNEKEDNVVKIYQAVKRKPHNEAQARKNMMIYLRNVVGFKMDYFKGMTYDDILTIFEKHFYSNVAFLLKIKEQMDEEDNRALKRLNESQEQRLLKAKVR
nr:hypothetical protein [Tanacetum cinerariifolium]